MAEQRSIRRERNDYSIRETRYVKNMARAAIGFAGRPRERSGPKPTDNIRRAMQQHPREYWSKAEGERARLARLIRTEIAQMQSEQKSRARQDMLAAQKAIAVESQLRTIRKEESALVDEIWERDRKARLKLEHEVLDDAMYNEQEEMEDWRAENRP